VGSCKHAQHCCAWCCLRQLCLISNGHSSPPWLCQAKPAAAHRHNPVAGRSCRVGGGGLPTGNSRPQEEPAAAGWWVGSYKHTHVAAAGFRRKQPDAAAVHSQNQQVYGHPLGGGATNRQQVSQGSNCKPAQQVMMRMTWQCYCRGCQLPKPWTARYRKAKPGPASRQQH